MNLRVSYDPAPRVDVLDITAETRPWSGIYPEAKWDLVVKVGENHNRDVIGLLIIGASWFVGPYFRPNQESSPNAGDEQFTDYDRATDTLTWGITTAAPELVSHTGDLTVYWQPDHEDADYFPIIGVSLLNAAKHLAPFFARVEPPAGAEGKDDEPAG